MFIDASALIALLTEEHEARELLARLQQSRSRLTSPLAIWEAAIGVAGGSTFRSVKRQRR